MKLINLLSGRIPFERSVIGLGTFDGLHLGHKTLISNMIHRARELSLPSVIFTFDHSPKRILNPDEFLGEITTPEEKFGLLLASGVDWVVFRPFEQSFAGTSAAEFIQNVIVDQLHAMAVFIGFNFGFGLGRAGNAKFLAAELRRLKIECSVLSPVTYSGTSVSSTKIRELIREGSIDLANHLLGKEISFSGLVVHGDHRGRTLGFPTANLELEGTVKVLPPHGVYFCLVDTPQGTYNSMVNIGVRPTFDRKIPILEAHLLDFTGDLYHQTIRIRYLKKLRGEIKFPSKDDLVIQLKKDLAVVRELTEKKEIGDRS